MGGGIGRCAIGKLNRRLNWPTVTILVVNISGSSFCVIFPVFLTIDIPKRADGERGNAIY